MHKAKKYLLTGACRSITGFLSCRYWLVLVAIGWHLPLLAGTCHCKPVFSIQASTSPKKIQFCIFLKYFMPYSENLFHFFLVLQTFVHKIVSFFENLLIQRKSPDRECSIGEIPMSKKFSDKYKPHTVNFLDSKSPINRKRQQLSPNSCWRFLSMRLMLTLLSIHQFCNLSLQ